MTLQEAIKFLEETKVGCKFVRDKQLLDVCNIAISAIEKQIPKKVLPDSKYYGNGICPNCNAVFVDKSTNFCGNCGQALDWSDQ